MDAWNAPELYTSLGFMLDTQLDWCFLVHFLHLHKLIEENVSCRFPLQPWATFDDYLPLVHCCSLTLNESYMISGSFTSISQGSILTTLSICLLRRQLACFCLLQEAVSLIDP